MDYYDVEWFALQINRDYSVIFEIASKYCILDCFVDYESYSIPSKGFLSTVGNAMSSELNLPISLHFSSLIPKISMSTLAMSYMNTSSLPWFMGLTFQVYMQHCSLQHQSLLSPPDTFTTKCCFHFGSAASFFLELLVLALRSSLVAYWIPSDLGGIIFWCLIFLPFHVHGVLLAITLEWFAISSSSGLHFVRTLHYGPSISGSSAQHGSQVIELPKCLGHSKVELGFTAGQSDSEPLYSTCVPLSLPIGHGT